MDTQRILNSTNLQDSTFVDGLEFTNRSLAQHIMDQTIGNESMLIIDMPQKNIRSKPCLHTSKIDMKNKGPYNLAKIAQQLKVKKNFVYEDRLCEDFALNR